MSIYGRRNPENTALVEFPLTPRDLNQRGRNFGPNPHDPTLEDSEFVMVREDARPELTYGQEAVHGPVEKRADGHWHQPWQVVEPTPERASEIRAQLRARAEAIAADKRQALSTAHILTFMELDRLEDDATPTPAEYPLLAAVVQGRTDGGVPTTFAQAVAGAQNFRTNWIERAARVERKYHEIIGRINTASTLAEARAILTEIEELV